LFEWLIYSLPPHRTHTMSSTTTAGKAQHSTHQNEAVPWHQLSENVLHSPVQLNGMKRSRNESVEDTEDEDGIEQCFSDNPSPSDTNQTTPDWNLTPTKSPAYPSKTSRRPTRSPLRANLGRSSPPANRYSNVQAAQDRPLYHDRSYSNSSNSSSSSPAYRSGPSAAKRLLMPTIPVRRDSAGRNQGEGSQSKSTTNIQSLAQAIAARAQHVAAGNALARGEYVDTSSPTLLSSLQDSRGSTTGQVASSPAINSMSDYVKNAKWETNRDAISVPGDSESSTPKAATFEQSPLDAPSAEQNVRRISVMDEQDAASVYSRDSYRWSKGDWIDFPSSGRHTQAGDGYGRESFILNDAINGKLKTSDSEHSAGSTGQTSVERGQLLKLDGSYMDSHSSIGASSTKEPSMRGLEYAQDAVLLPHRPLSPSSSSMVANTSIHSLESFVTASGSTPISTSQKMQQNMLTTPEHPNQPSPNDAGDASFRTASVVGGERRRKSRQSSMTSSSGPSSPPRTPAALARTLASPATGRTKTPPPTMPPAAPLPPLPHTPATDLARRSLKNGQLIAARLSTESDKPNPLMAAFALAQSTQKSNEDRAKQDASSSVLPMKSLDQGESDTFGRHRSSQSVSSFAGRSAALVQAHHASSLAGRESAQAVLEGILPEPSFNEKNASPQRSGAPLIPSFSTPTEYEDMHRDTIKSHAANGADTISQDETFHESSQGSLLPCLVLSSEGEDEEDQEEAVLTKVTKLNTHLPPLLNRTGSASLVTTLKGITGTREAQNRQYLSAVDHGTMPARLERSKGAAELDAEPAIRKATSERAAGGAEQDTSAITAKPSDTAILQPGQSEPWTPTIARPALSAGHSEYGNSTVHNDSFPPLQDRRGEMQEDRSRMESPDESFDRIKRTEGRFAGAFGEVAIAFKQLQAEKRTLEKVIRATTPLEGLGDGEDLSRYLTTMSSRLALSVEEIRKLLDLLDQQRSIMDYMLETHQLELDAHVNEIDDLSYELNEAITESETHRVNCVRLTEELDRAHNDGIAARAETLRAKSASAEEEGKRSRLSGLLLLARSDLSRLQSEKEEATRALQRGREAHEETRAALQTAKTEHVHEVTSLRRDLQSYREERGLPDSSPSPSQWREMQDELVSLRLQVVAAAAEHRMEPAPTSSGNVETSSPTTSRSDTEATDQVLLLQRRMGESRISQAEAEPHLPEAMKREGSGLLTGSTSPPVVPGGSTDVEEALRDRVNQQENDIAELRATIALGAGAGAGAGSSKDGQAASLPALSADRADQVKILLADLAEKRSREVQILTAYKQLKDELRKVQLAQQQDRRRSQASFQYLVAGGAGSGGSSSGHGGGGAPPSSYSGMHHSVDSSTPSTPPISNRRGETSKQLKRLSLPLTSIQYNGFNFGGAGGGDGDGDGSVGPHHSLISSFPSP
jgi:hypothetical protein